MNTNFNMEDKVVEFHRFVSRARQRCGKESSHILNMDETPMKFELTATRTLETEQCRSYPAEAINRVSRLS